MKAANQLGSLRPASARFGAHSHDVFVPLCQDGSPRPGSEAHSLRAIPGKTALLLEGGL